MGSYHGHHGYKLLSHSKAVMHKSEWLDAPQRYDHIASHALVSLHLLPPPLMSYTSPLWLLQVSAVHGRQLEAVQKDN